MANIETWLADWFVHRSPQVVLAPTDNYFESGVIDSLGVIELIEEMERTFSVQFSQGDFQDQRFLSVSGLAEMLSEKTGT
jgi:acyl carrier protein